jgi:hypothetical protein
MAISTTSGSFTGTGQSATVRVKRATVGINGGTATITIQVKIDPDATNWYDVYTFTSSDETREIEMCEARDVRLSCSAYTSETLYSISGVER